MAKTMEELLKEALVPVEEQPYGVPENWVWTKVSSVNEVVTGTTPSKSKDEYYGKFIPFIKPNDLDQGRWLNCSTEYLSEEGAKYARVVPKGSTAICCIGSIGKAAFVNIDSTTNQQINTLIPSGKVDALFTYYYSLSPEFQQLLNAKSSATTISIINKTKVSELPYALAPLCEQQRIVTKIESLFSKIDKAKELIEEAREGFENRKSAILARAFRGELTEKWREESFYPVDSTLLFNKIKEERFKVIGTKREQNDIIEMFKDIEYIDEELPKGWILLKSNMFCYNINCGSTPTKDITSEGEVPFLKVYNIVDNKVDFQYKPQYISKEINNKLNKSILIPNDIIMNIVGPPLRKIAIIPEYHPEWNMNQAIVRFRPIKYVVPKFVYYALINKDTLDEVITETRGVVGQSNISVNQSRNLTFPIPPIEEQHKIVRILDNLLSFESKVEELTQLEDQIELLKKSILAKAFRGELGTNDPTEESAIELLEEVLKERIK